MVSRKKRELQGGRKIKIDKNELFFVTFTVFFVISFRGMRKSKPFFFESVIFTSTVIKN